MTATSLGVAAMIACVAPVNPTRAQEPDAERPVLLDFGQGNAAPTESPSDTPTEPVQVEAVPLPPDVAPAQAPPPPANGTPKGASNVPVAQPLDLHSGDTQSDSLARLSLYLELLGPGLLYSFNVDLVVADVISLRAGYSSFTFFGSITLFPLMVSYLGYGTPNERYELGVGAVIAESGLDSNVLPTALFGYRYQPVGGGLIFRVGATVLMSTGEGAVIPWPYLSLGATF